MKKVLLVVLCLMVATAAFAQVSAPSNLVGYVKFTCPSGSFASPSYQPFGLPFVFWDVVAGVPQYGVASDAISDILGAQGVAGTPGTADILLGQTGGTAWRTTGTTWFGTLTTLLPGKAYWYQNRNGGDVDLVLAGEVDNSGNYGVSAIPAAVSASQPSYVDYAWRDSRILALEDLNLIEDGFLGGAVPVAQSDRLLGQSGGTAYYDTDLGGFWDPTSTLTQIDPGRAYWIVNRHTTNSWNYSYDGAPAAALVASNGHEGVITRAASSPKTSDNARAVTSVKITTTKTKTDAGKATSVQGDTKSKSTSGNSK